MSEAAGTSSRMLIYHFGTKDELVREVLQEARRRQRELLGDVLEAQGELPYVTVLRQAWPRLTSSEAMPYHELFRELHDLPAEDSPWPEFRTDATTEWVSIIEQGLRTNSYVKPRILATLVVSTVRGLLLDLHVTSDRKRIDAAFDTLMIFLASAPTRSGSPS
jgi:AcrR family transcriptional regulator